MFYFAYIVLGDCESRDKLKITISVTVVCLVVLALFTVVAVTVKKCNPEQG